VDDAPELVHGTCVALGRSAALLRGPSGSGKSDLALRFLFLARRGPAAIEAPVLVADDQVEITRAGAQLVVRSPATIGGRMEVRGVGIVEVKHLEQAELALIVDLVATLKDVERLPDDGARTRLMGVDVPSIRLCPWEASAAIKLAVALARAKRP
jgi:serine kinase of HPr protein (carbohydrate metabolism regulator)